MRCYRHTSTQSPRALRQSQIALPEGEMEGEMSPRGDLGYSKRLSEDLHRPALRAC